jgi:hypothetical protein
MPAEQKPSTPIEALDIVPTRLRNIKTLLTIFCTLPVTTCTAERSFSAMRLLKNHLRTSMMDQRLTGLALMYIHPEIDINIDNVIDQFASVSVPLANYSEHQGNDTDSESTDTDNSTDKPNVGDECGNGDSSQKIIAVKRRRLNLM